MKAYTQYVEYNKELGGYEYNIYVYAEFFAQNIQDCSILEDGTKYYAYPFGRYVQLSVSNEEHIKNITDNMQKLFPDKEFDGIQTELEEKIGIQVDGINLYVLCDFIDKVVREEYFILLKPTVKDIVAEIKEIKEAKELVLTNADGSKVSITNSKMIEAALTAMKECEDDSKNYEDYKLVRIDEFANNVLIQSRFAYWVAATLKEFFPNAKRRKNCCMVSEVEQRLILKMLSYFKLAPEGVSLTPSRFRQLINYYDNTKKEESISNFPDEIGRLPVTFVKYEDWHRKDIDWQNPKLQLHPMADGETVTFSK